jgi:hypothetical protein
VIMCWWSAWLKDRDGHLIGQAGVEVVLVVVHGHVRQGNRLGVAEGRAVKVGIVVAVGIADTARISPVVVAVGHQNRKGLLACAAAIGLEKGITALLV